MRQKRQMRFRPSQRLLTKGDYETVFSARRKFRTEYFTIYYCGSSAVGDRLGLTVSKKLGNAVIRNRYKRKIRDLFRTNNDDQMPYIDIVLRPDKSFLNATHDELNDSWRFALGKIRKRIGNVS